MPPILALVVNLTAAALLVLVGLRAKPEGGGGRAAAVTVLPLLSAGVLAFFVFSDDSYRDDGTSRWDAYRSDGGALAALFVVSLSAMAVSAALLAYSATRARGGLFRSTAVVAGLAAGLLSTATVIAFSAN